MPPAAPPELPRNVFQEDAAAVDADALIAHLAAPRMGTTLTWAIAGHVALILLTSIPFILLCFRHGTLHPRAVIEQQRKEGRERELEAERESARQRIAADRAKQKAGAGGAAAGKPGTGKKPKVIQELEGKSGKRPTEPDVRLDDDLRLD